MIGKLKGILSEIDGNDGLIETKSGVFYQTYLTPRLINENKPGTQIELYTYLQVREDALVLFSFSSKKEHNFFKLLLTVPGVGPKTAYNVISFSTVDEAIAAVKNNDSNYFTKIPGLGKKTALKIMLELSHKLEHEFKLEKTYLSEEDKTVIDALVSLGFKSQEAHQILSKIPKDLSLEDKIKESLRLVSKKK